MAAFVQAVNRALERGRTGVGRGVAVVVLGSGGAQLILLLASPLLTRLYTPADFGAYAAVAALFAALLPIACLRYESAIVIAPEDDDATSLLLLAVLTALVTTVVIGAFLLLFSDRIFDALNATQLKPWLGVFLAGQLAAGATLALTAQSMRARDFRRPAVARLGQAGTTAGAQVGLGAIVSGSMGLALGDAAGRLVGMFALLRRDLVGGTRRAASPGRLKTLALRYRRFPMLGSWAALLNAAVPQLPLILFAVLFGAATSGLFAFGQRLVGAPISLFSVAIGQVLFAEGARNLREDPVKVRSTFAATVRPLAIAGAPIMLLVALAGIFLFAPVFGESWREAGIYVALLAPLNYVRFVVSPFGGTLDLLERQDLHLLREIARLALMTGAIVLAFVLALDPRGAVAAVSVTGCAANLIYGVTAWRALAQHGAATTAGLVG